MSRYHLDIDLIEDELVQQKADSMMISVEEYLSHIVHNHIVSMHSIKEEDYEKAYVDQLFLDIDDIY